MEIEVTRKEKIAVKFLSAECGVRYWEDATVNGEEDANGELIPMREGDCWKPVIDLETGTIQDWPEGTIASVHYKVCDAGRYTLMDAAMNPVVSIDGYVPKIMCPEDSGYGDYVIMKIDGSGRVNKWEPILSSFEGDDQ